MSRSARRDALASDVAPPPPLRPSAKVSELARHLRLGEGATRARLTEAGLAPVALGPVRYAWSDVWERLEGRRAVLPEAANEIRRPLLTAEEVREPDLPHLAARTITGRASRGTLPAIKRGTDWRFVEAEAREAARHG